MKVYEVGMYGPLYHIRIYEQKVEAENELDALRIYRGIGYLYENENEYWVKEPGWFKEVHRYVRVYINPREYVMRRVTRW